MPTPKKAYAFTLNNYTDDEYSALVRICSTESQYAILGREIGERGTPHIQGYIRFKRSCRFATIKDRYLPRCHIEVAHGSARQNRTYCSKGGDYREFGECPGDADGGGSRDALARDFVQRLGEGRAGVRAFADANPGTWYFSGHNLLRNYLTLQPAIDRGDIRVDWFYGPPGIGKSRNAHELLPEAYIKEPRTKWWNGYMLEKEVIIDDFGPGGIDINHLLRWFDRYKCFVEYKGGMLPLYASRFIVTSNYHPSECFSSTFVRFGESVTEEHPQIDALMRRLSIKHFA